MTFEQFMKELMAADLNRPGGNPMPIDRDRPFKHEDDQDDENAPEDAKQFVLTNLKAYTPEQVNAAFERLAKELLPQTALVMIVLTKGALLEVPEFHGLGNCDKLMPGMVLHMMEAIAEGKEGPDGEAHH